jgi:hypothetical protein
VRVREHKRKAITFVVDGNSLMVRDDNQIPLVVPIPRETEAGHSGIPAQRRDRKPALSDSLVGSCDMQLGRVDNGHLNSFTESTDMNVGGYPETNVPSSREEKHG